MPRIDAHRSETHPIDEEVEEVTLGFELHVLDPADQRLELGTAGRRQQEIAGTPGRRVAGPHDSIDRDRRQQPDRRRVLDVERVGEPAGEDESVEPVAWSPSRRRRIQIPAVVAAFAWRSALTSARVRPIRRSDTTSIDAATPANVPSSRTKPASRAAPSRSMRPEPQIPSGSVAPIVRHANRSPIQRTVSIAPSTATIPRLMPPPSNAGPAGLDAATIRRPSLATISVFVPMSSRSEPPVSPSNPVATRSAARSAPTWLPTSGAPMTRPRGWMSSPSS